ncbi:MAG TPA: hypothetical protein PLW55_02590, partial [Leptospiraceae bacterium]|nr:hypothetical protein [Leptospiraceae bacterium]
RCTSFRYGARSWHSRRIIPLRFILSARADARKFGIIEARAPRRAADKLTGTPDISHLQRIIVFNRSKWFLRDNSLRSKNL